MRALDRTRLRYPGKLYCGAPVRRPSFLAASMTAKMRLAIAAAVRARAIGRAVLSADLAVCHDLGHATLDRSTAMQCSWTVGVNALANPTGRTPAPLLGDIADGLCSEIIVELHVPASHSARLPAKLRDVQPRGGREREQFSHRGSEAIPEPEGAAPPRFARGRPIQQMRPPAEGASVTSRSRHRAGGWDARFPS